MGGEPVQTNQNSQDSQDSQEGVGTNEVETDHGVDAAALEAKMAAALAELGKEETPELKTTFKLPLR